MLNGWKLPHADSIGWNEKVLKIKFLRNIRALVLPVLINSTRQIQCKCIV